MNRIILQLFAVGFCFVLGHALQCYECKLGIGSLCITTKETCESNERCFSGEGTAASVTIKMKGCLAVEQCNKTSEVNFPTSGSNTTLYQMTKTCCNTDLCNAAPALTSGLSLALAALSALFVTYILV